MYGSVNYFESTVKYLWKQIIVIRILFKITEIKVFFKNIEIMNTKKMICMFV